MFNKFTDDSGLFCPSLVGGKFTWKNCRAAMRINRFLLSED